MERIMLNGMTMNDAVRELVINAKERNYKRYGVQCDNCMLSIWTSAHYMEDDMLGKFVEVALLNKKGNEYIKVYPDDYKDYATKEDDLWIKDFSEIAFMPIIAIPLFVQTFKHIELSEMESVWNAFTKIANNYEWTC